MHHVKHDFGHVYLFTPRELLFLSCIVVVSVPGSIGVLSLLLVEEGGDSVLSPELLPRLFR